MSLRHFGSTDIRMSIWGPPSQVAGKVEARVEVREVGLGTAVGLVVEVGSEEAGSGAAEDSEEAGSEAAEDLEEAGSGAAVDLVVAKDSEEAGSGAAEDSEEAGSERRRLRRPPRC
jgi:hypothetical protein